MKLKILSIILIILMVTGSAYFVATSADASSRDIYQSKITNPETTNNSISISGNAGFLSCPFVNGGNGTEENPFRISNITVNVSTGSAISITYTTDHFILENLTLILDQNDSLGGINGIYLYNVSNATIRNVSIFSPTYPPTYFVNRTKVYEPSVNRAGISAFSSRYVNISGVRVRNMAQGGIGFQNCVNSSVSDSWINYTVIDGLSAFFSSNITFTGNHLFYDHHNNIQILNSSNIRVEDNLGFQSNGTNIWLWNASDSQVINNTVSGCTHQSILVSGFSTPAFNDIVAYNTIYNSSQGIVPVGVYDSRVYSNEIINCSEGIVVGDYQQPGVNITISDNVIKYSNSTGMVLYWGSNNNTVSGNTVSYSGTGILDWGAPNNTYYSNIVFGNSYGIRIQGSDGMLAYNNYFSNVNNAISDSQARWNVTPYVETNVIGGPEIAGNYWSNYNGEGSDGIGLTYIPYNNGGQIEYGGDYEPLIYAGNTTLSLEDFSGSYSSYVYIPVTMYGGSSFLNLSQTFEYNPMLLNFSGILSDVSSQNVNFSYTFIFPGILKVNGTGFFDSFLGKTILYTLIFRSNIQQQLNTDVLLSYSKLGNNAFTNTSIAKVSLSSGWETIGPRNLTFQFGNSPVVNGSGEVTCFGFSQYYPNIIYAGSGIKGQWGFGGIYRSVDGGKTWSNINFGLSYLSVESISVNPYNPDEVVIIAQGLNWWNSGAIYKTVNGGLTWQETYPEGGLSLYYNNGKLYAATFHHLIVSTDFGSTWKELGMTGENFPQGTLENIFVENDGETIYAMVSGGETYSGNGSDYIMFSNNYGNEFTVLSTVNSYYGVYYQQIVQDPSNSSHMWLIMFGGYSFDSLFHSNDSGKIWEQVNLTKVGLGKDFHAGIGYAPQFMAYNPFYPSVIYLAGDMYFYVSTDDGANFTKMVPGPNFDVRFIYPDPYVKNEMFIGADQGLFVTYDNCSEWVSLNNRSTSLLTDMAISGKNIITNVADYSSIDSNDSGSTWYMNRGLLQGEGGVSATDPYDSSIVIFMTGTLAVSQNGGETFFVPSGNISGISKPPLTKYVTFKNGGTESLIAFSRIDPGYIFIAGKNGIYESHNYGSSFIAINGSPKGALSISVTVNNTIIVSNSSGLYASYDLGMRWVFIDGEFTGYKALESVSPDPLNSSVILATSDFDGVTTAYLSNNGGKSFYYANISSDYILPAPGNACFLNDSGKAVLVFMSGDGIYISYDMGKIWENKSFDLNTESSVTSLSLINGTAYISTWGDGVLFSVDMLNESYYSTSPLMYAYVPAHSSISVNGETFNSQGYSQIILSEGINIIKYDVNGTISYNNISANASYVYFLNLSPSTVTLNIIENGIPAGSRWTVGIDNVTRAFYGNVASLNVITGHHVLSAFPSSSDFSMYFPQSENFSFNVYYRPVTLYLNYTEVLRTSYYNITSAISGNFWTTDMAANLGYIAYGGGGNVLLMKENTSDIENIGNPFPDGQIYSVISFEDGFVFGGAYNSSFPGLSYYNITAGKFENNIIIPEKWNGTDARITSLFIVNNREFGLIGGAIGKTFLGVVDKWNIDVLNNYLPVGFNYSNGAVNTYSSTYISEYGAVMISNGIETVLFYLSNFTYYNISSMVNFDFQTGFTTSFSPSYSFMASDGNSALLVGEYASGSPIVGYFSPKDGFKDISSIFPENYYFDSVSCSGRDYIMAGTYVGKNSSNQTIFLYNSSSGALTEVPVPGLSSSSILDSSIMVSNSLYYSTFNSKNVGSYSVLSSFYGKINVDPVGHLIIHTNVAATVKIANWYYKGQIFNISELAGNWDVCISSKGFKNVTENVSITPFSITVLNVILLNSSYSITFNESGLRAGTLWFVNLSNGQSFSSTTNTITFSEPNGIYSYTISTTNKNYSPNLSSGSFTVNGTVVNVAVTFNLVTSIIFAESGLPSGTAWYINLSNGQSFSSTTDTITFTEPNGSYAYSIATSNKEYAPLDSKGSFSVNGSNVNISLSFKLVIYEITFTESGLPSGTSWSVTLNGTTETSTTNTITFQEPYGTYSYSILIPSGYKTASFTGSITTTQSSLNIPISISSITPSSSPTNYLIYVIIAVVVIAAVVGVALAIGRRKNKPSKQ